jgi:RNA-directed DNA polymerase
MNNTMDSGRNCSERNCVAPPPECPTPQQWCRRHRHDDVEVQRRALSRSLLGHYAYYGVTSNSGALERLCNEVKVIWRKWLSRRSQRAFLNWRQMNRLLTKYPLPQPRIVHRYT